MENQIAIKIKYYALGIGNYQYEGETELIQFKSRIHEEYLSTFEVQTAERGGSNFIIEFLYNISLTDFLSFILGGIVWDLVKGAGKQFILRPFIELYREFRKKRGAQEIRDITFIFNDARVCIYSIVTHSPEMDFELVGRIFNILAENYTLFNLQDLNAPKEIHIPIFLDNVSLKTPSFRLKLEYDDPLYELGNIFNSDAYFQFWGLEYMDYQKYVFNVAEKQLIKQHWYVEDEFEWYVDLEKEQSLKRKLTSDEENL